MNTLRNEIYAAAIINVLLLLWFIWWCAQLLKRKCPACGYRNRSGRATAPSPAYDRNNEITEASRSELNTHLANSRYCKRCRHDLTT
ncbi:MAG: hypothetical protein F2799_00025 [Actinobacteria bacterium]|uniref:Unannotated protein n=1 Tax=freshwater metagenome TaxID=449393 RepID=A0A6J7CHM1_9ZZZZ|nr:hypothetical protein [Actinomycetota bacterium]